MSGCHWLNLSSIAAWFVVEPHPNWRWCPLVSCTSTWFWNHLKSFEIYCLGRLSRGLRQTAGNYCLVLSVSGCRWWIEGCQTIALRMMSCPPANPKLNSISHQSATERLRQLLNSKNAGCRLGDAFITDCFHALRNSQESFHKTKKHNRPNSTRIASIFLRLQVQKWKLPSGAPVSLQ
jgi:hypothetical protein